MRLAVVGAGYVGLVSAASLARLGHDVVCIDSDASRIARLQLGEMPFHEPGLADAVEEGRASDRLGFNTDPGAQRGCSATLVAVGTLDRAGEWSAAHVERALEQIVRDPRAPRTIVIRSTLAPGTGAELERRARAIDERMTLVINPEFTRQGAAMADFMEPDRIVIGASDAASPATNLVREIFRPIDAPLLVTDITSAETIKFASNVFLALKIGFANELARLSAALGADIAAVTRGVGLDSRIGPSFLGPGPGFGGSCLPSQARALPQIARGAGVAMPIVHAIDTSNRLQADWVASELEHALGGLARRRVTVLGMTFKAGTDDLRESPAVAVAVALDRCGAVLTVHDPMAGAAAASHLARAGVAVQAAGEALAAVAGSEAVVVATDWDEYRSIDWAAATGSTSGRVVLDARGVIDAAAARAAGFRVIVRGAPAAPGAPSASGVRQ